MNHGSFGQSYQASAFHSSSWSDAQRTHLKSSLLMFGWSKLSNNYIPHKIIIGCIPAFDEAGDPSWYNHSFVHDRAGHMSVPDGSDVTTTKNSILAFVGIFSLLSHPNW